MILYHCVTMYQVLEAIVHRERVHSGEYSVLLLADFSADKYHNFRELEAFFDEVRLFPYRRISNNPDTILEEVDNAYRSSVPYKAAQFDHIYVAAAFYYFSLYLMANGISFHMFEDGGGILSKPRVLYEIIRDVTPIMADIAQTYGLLDGQNDYIQDAICNFCAQSFIADDPKWKNFDLSLEITRLSPETIREILNFFRLQIIRDIPGNAVMVFTQQFANLFTTSLEDQIAIYQVCADFFFPDQPMIIKPHPDDTTDYPLYFPEARMVHGRFPAELLPILLERVPDTSFTVSSSSVRNIRSIFKTNIICGFDFPNTFPAIDRYYFSVKLISEMEEVKNCSVHTLGVDVCLLEAIAEHSLKASLSFVHETALKKKSGGRRVWLIDDCSFRSDYFETRKKELSFAYRRVKVKGVEPPNRDISRDDPGSIACESQESSGSLTDTASVCGFPEAFGEDDLVIFLNSRNDTWFYDEDHKEMLSLLIPLRVRKRRLREENVFFPDSDFTLYVYSENGEIRERVMRFQAEITLKNAGLAERIQGPEPKTESFVPGNTISMDEYLDLAMDLNDMSMKAFLQNKINLFLREGLRGFMHRPALAPAFASDEEILRFLRTFGKAVGKRNTSAGEGFQIYTDRGTDEIGRIRSEGTDILEPYIRQHPAYQEIYPDSLNTLRIHTVRSSSGVRCFLPVMLSIGSGGMVTDLSDSAPRYRVLLTEDGTVIQAFRQDPGEAWLPACRHHNTGYSLKSGIKLPGIQACVEYCRMAAFYVPEMRYIGWDAAFTEKGPVIVEANNISGSVYFLQQAKEATARTGVREDIEAMLAYGMEGAEYNQRKVFVSRPLADAGASLPDLTRLYLILLQSALHRRGVEFYDRKYILPRHAEVMICSIRYLEEENLICLKAGQKTVHIPQPDIKKQGLLPYGEDKERPCISEKDFFALDQIASQEAERIYLVMAADAGSNPQLNDEAL